MIYKIAICDDRWEDRSYLRSQVENWAAKRRCQVQINEFSSAESFLFQYEEKKDYDILLLDIEMAGMDGVALAKRIRKDNEAVQIVFVTGYADYISEGYEVAALHYLMKPVRQEKMFEVLDRAGDKLKKNERVLLLSIAGEMVRIPLYQIRLLEVQGNYVTIHAKQQYVLKKTLCELAGELDERFYRVGRTAIVNLAYIGRVTKTEIYLNEGTKVPLPRGSYEGVNRAIIGQK